jgi:hypothetical protein
LIHMRRTVGSKVSAFESIRLWTFKIHKLPRSNQICSTWKI